MTRIYSLLLILIIVSSCASQAIRYGCSPNYQGKNKLIKKAHSKNISANNRENIRPIPKKRLEKLETIESTSITPITVVPDPLLPKKDSLPLKNPSLLKNKIERIKSRPEKFNSTINRVLPHQFTKKKVKDRDGDWDAGFVILFILLTLILLLIIFLIIGILLILNE